MNGTFDRRSLLLAATGAGLSACAGEPAAPADAARMPRGITLTYVGAPDCPQCRYWYADARGPWLASPERARVNFIERDVPSLRHIGLASAWPADIRWLHGEMRQRNIRIGAPAFVISEDQDFVAGASGFNAWARVILPTLRERLAAVA